jgi:hypothetical protein
MSTNRRAPSEKRPVVTKTPRFVFSPYLSAPDHPELDDR